MVTGQADWILGVPQADGAWLDLNPRIHGEAPALKQRSWPQAAPDLTHAALPTTVISNQVSHLARVLLAWSLHSRRVRMTATKGPYVLMSESSCRY